MNRSSERFRLDQIAIVAERPPMVEKTVNER